MGYQVTDNEQWIEKMIRGRKGKAKIVGKEKREKRMERHREVFILYSNGGKLTVADLVVPFCLLALETRDDFIWPWY
jgi:hypothetical protein